MVKFVLAAITALLSAFLWAIAAYDLFDAWLQRVKARGPVGEFLNNLILSPSLRVFLFFVAGILIYSGIRENRKLRRYIDPKKLAELEGKQWYETSGYDLTENGSEPDIRARNRQPEYELKTRSLGLGVTEYKSVEKHLDPELELMHFSFDPVGTNKRGSYVRVGRKFSGEHMEAAILDFRLRPVRDAVPWVEARAHILFKDENNQQVRVGAGVWLGRDQPKVPFRPGETQSLILTGAYSAGDVQLTTYEHGPRGEEDERIERPLCGDNIRVAIGVIAEYMDEPRFDQTWYFKLTRIHSKDERVFFSPDIKLITPEEFERRLPRW